MPVWDLEYMLLFGPPENKLELIRGQTPCSFPFADRATADAHFALWAGTLARWQGIADPPARATEDAPVKEFGKFKLKQYRRPLRLEVPSVWEAYTWAHRCFWHRSLWPMQPAGFETGVDRPQDHWDIKLNLCVEQSGAVLPRLRVIRRGTPPLGRLSAGGWPMGRRDGTGAG